MKNTFEKLNNWEIRKLEIERQVEYLKNNCMGEEERNNLTKILEEYSTKADSLSERRLDIALTWKKKIEKSTLTMQTLPELRYALEVMKLSKEVIEDTLAHENAHGNKADELGARHLGYKLTFAKSKNGGICFFPMAELYIPEEDEGWTKEKQKRVDEEITRAPEIYGNELSDSDKEKLK
ncbi:MAG: hypothetical protein ABH951_00200 [Patescibacteria group bacterium]